MSLLISLTTLKAYTYIFLKNEEIFFSPKNEILDSSEEVDLLILFKIYVSTHTHKCIYVSIRYK